MTDNSMKAIDDRVRVVFESIFSKRVEFRPDLERKDVKRWDSLKHVEFMIALEMEFSIRFDGSDATAITGVAKAVETVRGKLA